MLFGSLFHHLGITKENCLDCARLVHRGVSVRRFSWEEYNAWEGAKYEWSNSGESEQTKSFLCRLTLVAWIGFRQQLVAGHVMRSGITCAHSGWLKTRHAAESVPSEAVWWSIRKARQKRVAVIGVGDDHCLNQELGHVLRQVRKWEGGGGEYSTLGGACVTASYAWSHSIMYCGLLYFPCFHLPVSQTDHERIVSRWS